MSCPYINVCKYIEAYKNTPCEEDSLACLYFETNREIDRRELAHIRRRNKNVEAILNEYAKHPIDTL